MKRFLLILLASLISACGSSDNETPKAEAPHEIDLGYELYHRHCASCHGWEAVSGSLPDLREAAQATYDNWVTLVLEGSKDPMLMPAFKNKLSAEQALLIRDYVLRRRAEDAQ